MAGKKTGTKKVTKVPYGAEHAAPGGKNPMAGVVAAAKGGKKKK